MSETIASLEEEDRAEREALRLKAEAIAEHLHQIQDELDELIVYLDDRPLERPD